MKSNISKVRETAKYFTTFMTHNVAYPNSRKTRKREKVNCLWQERPSRWWRSKTWRSTSSPQIHQKHIYMWNNSYRTPTECWQKTSNFPKVWLAGSWCSGWVSSLSLWGRRAELRTWVNKKPPGSMQYQIAKALLEISILVLRPSYSQWPASYSAGHLMPNN